MKFVVYWLISEDYQKTYVGYSEDFDRRVVEHQRSAVKTTKNFGKFKYRILEEVNNLAEAIVRERYWKSHAGRKKLAVLYKQITYPSRVQPEPRHAALSSNG